MSLSSATVRGGVRSASVSRSNASPTFSRAYKTAGSPVVGVSLKACSAIMISAGSSSKKICVQIHQRECLCGGLPTLQETDVEQVEVLELELARLEPHLDRAGAGFMLYLVQSAPQNMAISQTG